MSNFITICVAKEREVIDLKQQLARMTFLYGDAIARIEENTKRASSPNKFIDDSESVISVSGSDVSVFDEDESVLAPQSDEFIRVKRHTYTELPAAEYHSYEEEEVFEDAVAKPPTKYNKARYERSLRMCSCGHKVSSIKAFAKRHENTRRHQLLQQLSSVE